VARRSTPPEHERAKEVAGRKGEMMDTKYLESQFSLEGKTAVITGGGGTLGSVMGAGFAKVGANVMLWDVREDALKEKAERLRKECGDAGRVDYTVVDLMNEESIQSALDAGVKRFGKVDILLNACGGNRGKCPLVEQKVEDYEFVLRLNLIAGCLAPTKAYAKYCIANKMQGSIINIASMSSYIPLSGVWAYDAAKSAVMNQTMAFAKELAPHGIRVNALAPGFFLADQNRALLIDEKTGKPTQRGLDVLARTPMKRFGEPSELCGAAILLASGSAGGFISGITVPVDGAFLTDNI
jgi:NAD(P)-dependent dehydrogenase (short-subunit alcohol dehydrogenase family)